MPRNFGTVDCLDCNTNVPKTSGNMVRCSSCRTKYNQDYRKRQDVKDRRNANWRARYAKVGYAEHIARRYNISLEFFNEQSKNGCMACGSFERLVVDHDHRTGLYRGVLCLKCNAALGHLDESLEKIDGLRNYRSAFVG